MKIININDIGDVKIVKSSRAKNLNMVIKPFEGIKVSVPKNVSYEYAEKFIQKKSGWIRKKLKKISEIENGYTVFDCNTCFKTRYHNLVIKPWDKDTISVRIHHEKIDVKYPAERDVRDRDIQELIRSGINRALRIEAKEYLEERVSLLAKKHGFRYNKLFFKNAKTRWGSCSGKDNINLNIHLMRLTDDLIDYVILHELVHTVEKNHSKKFWNLLEKVAGEVKFKEKKLKMHRTRIY